MVPYPAKAPSPIFLICYFIFFVFCHFLLYCYSSYGTFLHSWCLRFLYVAYSHMNICSYEPQVRENMQNLSFWVSVNPLSIVSSSCIHLTANTKETFNWVKRKWTEWEMLLSVYSSDRGLIYRIYKELQNQSHESKWPN